MISFIDFVFQLHWIPFLGAAIFFLLILFEYRSTLGIFSPSGLVSLYAFIKFFMESLLILNFESVKSLAGVYGVTETQYITQSILISFLVSLLSYFLLWVLTYSLRKDYGLLTYDKVRQVTYGTRSTSLWAIPRVSLGYFILFSVGFLFLLIIFQSAGGIVNYVSNFASRTEMLAGYGAIVKFSTLFIQLAILYFFAINYKISEKKAYVILLLGMLMLFSLGGRTAPIFLLFASLVYVHFYCKKFQISFKLLLFLLIIFLAALYMSLLRFGNFDSLIQMDLAEIPFSLWFSIIGGYFSYIIRDSVIVSYFAENDFWYGAGLLSFFFAFIPRTLYSAKPVVDNGVYVIAMSNGQQVIPPMVPAELPHYGWPESYMSGYMEAGWLGLVIGVTLSCFLVSFIFSKLVKSDFKVEWVFLYCFFMFRQPLYLTSIDLFNIVFHLIFVLSIGFVVRKRFKLTC
jgi:hypothetical protein